MIQLLKIPNMRRFYFGQTLSLFGDTALFLALGIWVKSLTGSNGAAGLVFFALVLPSLGAPLSGLLVDRVRRRPLMIVTNCALVIVVLLLLFVRGPQQVWLIYVVAFLYGAGSSAFTSSQSALLTVMLPDEMLGEGNGLLQTIRESLRIVGPLSGAGLYAAFGGGVVAIVDAATFGISALTLASLNVAETVPLITERHFRTDVTAGVTHIWRSIVLRRIVATTAVALLVIGFAETIIFAVVSQGLHRPTSFIGVLSAAQGVGAIAGGLTAARLLRRMGDVRLAALGLAVFAAGESFLASSLLPAVLAGFVVAGLGVPWVIVAFGTAIQRRSPAELQGRVYSAADTLVGTPQTLSIALGAALSTIIDYRILIGVMAVVVMGCAGFLFTPQSEPVAVTEAA